MHPALLTEMPLEGHVRAAPSCPIVALATGKHQRLILYVACIHHVLTSHAIVSQRIHGVSQCLTPLRNVLFQADTNDVLSMVHFLYLIQLSMNC